MAQSYLQQNYGVPAQPGWEEDVKHTFNDGSAQLVDDQTFHEAPPHIMVDNRLNRQPSVVKLEDDFHTARMWSGHPQSPPYQIPPYPPTGPFGAHPEDVSRMYNQPRFMEGYGPPPPSWPMPSNSGSSTPTPLFGPAVDAIPVQFNSATGMFPYQQRPHRSVAMSPQSSQGGWASATSDDSGGQHGDPESPKYRPMSPMGAERPDGVRKKNARVEIPSNVNIENVERLILEATDEDAKKELKQQKRLLRNRQAALDSRSRKRREMDKLVDEKSKWVVREKDLTEEVARLKTLIDCERQQMMEHRQAYENYIQQVTFERDEAIRLRTIETTETRRQNNVLKDCVRDLERQQAVRGLEAPASLADNFHTNDFPSFGGLDLEDDSWEDEFSLIHSDDLKMENEDDLQRQLTPRPLPMPQATDTPAATAASKSDLSFSWNTFYICLLFGAYIASQQGSTPIPTAASASKQNSGPAGVALPSLSDEYRAEANNVLKAVLSSDNGAGTAILPSTPSASGQPMSSSQSHRPATSSLDILSNQLTTPTRQQQVAAAFALTPDQYEHIVNPEGLPSRPADAKAQPDPPSKPTPLQAMFATMQAERDEVERAVGLGGKARERSSILDRVPENVLQDFRRLVAEREGRAPDI